MTRFEARLKTTGNIQNKMARLKEWGQIGGASSSHWQNFHFSKKLYIPQFSKDEILMTSSISSTSNSDSNLKNWSESDLLILINAYQFIMSSKESNFFLRLRLTHYYMEIFYQFQII